MQDEFMATMNTQEMITSESKFLTFRLGTEEYGIPVEYVVEIIGIQPITSLPEVPSYIKGVINLRGKVIPVIDVRIRFEMQERKYDDRTCIIVVSIEEMLVGLIVDTVKEVIDIPDTWIEPPPRVQKEKSLQFVMALAKVEDSVKIILNVYKVVFSQEIRTLQKTALVS